MEPKDQSFERTQINESEPSLNETLEVEKNPQRRFFFGVALIVLILTGISVAVFFLLNRTEPIDITDVTSSNTEEVRLSDHEDVSSGPLIKPYLGTTLDTNLSSVSLTGDSWYVYRNKQSAVLATSTDTTLFEETLQGIELTAQAGEVTVIGREISFPNESVEFSFCFESTKSDDGHIELQFVPEGSSLDDGRLLTVLDLEHGELRTSIDGDEYMQKIGSWFEDGPGTINILLANTGEEPVGAKLVNFHYITDDDIGKSPRDAVNECLIKRADPVAEINSPHGSDEFRETLTAALQSEKSFSEPSAEASGLIVTIDNGITGLHREVFSPDGKVVAYSGSNSYFSSRSSYINDTELKDLRNGPVMSDDGTSIVYTTRRDENGSELQSLIVNDTETQIPNYTRITKLDFIPGTKIPYFVGTLNKKERLVVNSIEGPQWDEVEEVVFNSEGTGVMVSYKNKGLMYVDDNKTTYGPYPMVNTIAYSDDNSLAVFKVRGLPGDAFVVKGEMGPQFDWITGWSWIEGANQFYYTARKDEKVFGILFDGNKHITIDLETTGSMLGDYFVSTKNLGTTASIKEIDTVYSVTVNESSAGEYSSVSNFKIYPEKENPVFFTAKTLTGDDIAYVNSEAKTIPHERHWWLGFYGDDLLYKTEKGDKWLVVVNWEEGELYDNVSKIAEIGGNSDWYYVAEQNGLELLYVNGVLVGEYNEIFTDSIMMSEDDKTMYFGARVGQEMWWMVVTVPQ